METTRTCHGSGGGKCAAHRIENLSCRKEGAAIVSTRYENLAIGEEGRCVAVAGILHPAGTRECACSWVIELRSRPVSNTGGCKADAARNKYPSVLEQRSDMVSAWNGHAAGCFETVCRNHDREVLGRSGKSEGV